LAWRRHPRSKRIIARSMGRREQEKGEQEQFLLISPSPVRDSVTDRQ
jgi:hypothetical protein